MTDSAWNFLVVFGIGAVIVFFLGFCSVQDEDCHREPTGDAEHPYELVCE